jgi:hypothetical protein
MGTILKHRGSRLVKLCIPGRFKSKKIARRVFLRLRAFPLWMKISYLTWAKIRIEKFYFKRNVYGKLYKKKLSRRWFSKRPLS